LGWIQNEEFDEWEPSTVEAALRALLTLSEEQALSFCQETLARKTLFRRRALVDLKIAVATALGASESPLARAMLYEHVGTRDKSLQRACRDALEKHAARQARGILEDGKVNR